MIKEIGSQISLIKIIKLCSVGRFFEDVTYGPTRRPHFCAPVMVKRNGQKWSQGGYLGT